jgi:hypothetical protein
MAGNDTKQTLPEARARLEAALETFPRPHEDSQPYARLRDASEALLAALKAAELGEYQYVGGRFWWPGDKDVMVDFIKLEGKRGVLFFAEDEA